MLTPLGVKCVSRLDAHETPNGVLASNLSHAINMELLTEFPAAELSVLLLLLQLTTLSATCWRLEVT